MERMSPLDAGFWSLEDRHAALHIGSVAVFEGPVPAHHELRELFCRKLRLIPRYRQRMRRVPFAIGRPVWVDDPGFDLDYHLRRTAVAAPGSTEQLQRLVGRLMSQRLDPDRPLWESWIVEGLDGGRWAMVSKLHHSMVDGIAGIGVLSAILDEQPDADPGQVTDWEPAPGPSSVSVLARALADGALTAGQTARRLSGAALHPAGAVTAVGETVTGMRHFAGAIRPVSGNSLSGPLGSPRRYRSIEVDLADVATVRDALGGSINDVALALVTRGLRELLTARGETPDPHGVRCLVPVSVRAPEHGDRADNHVSALLLELPVEFDDTRSRYDAVLARMRRLKASHEAEAGEAVTTLAELVPSALLSAALWAAFRVPQRVLTTVVTNVPGSRVPLYAAGCRMIAHYPYVPIADRIRIGIAATSYDGRLYFGVTCDRASVPDADLITGGIADGLAELSPAPLPRARMSDGAAPDAPRRRRMAAHGPAHQPDGGQLGDVVRRTAGLVCGPRARP